jgi:hypothetical protein
MGKEGEKKEVAIIIREKDEKRSVVVEDEVKTSSSGNP